MYLPVPGIEPMSSALLGECVTRKATVADILIHITIPEDMQHNCSVNNEKYNITTYCASLLKFSTCIYSKTPIIRPSIIRLFDLRPNKRNMMTQKTFSVCRCI